MSEASDQFRKLHSGQTCFVLGNGPSLTKNIIRKIFAHGAPVLAVNGFSLATRDMGVAPTYAFMSNQDAVNLYFDLYPKKTVKFVKAGTKDPLPSNTHSLPFPCEHDKGHHLAPFIKDGHFSENPFVENFCGDTVVLDFAIPMAYFMGFSKIVIAGVDYDYSKGYFAPGYEKRFVPGFQGMVAGDYSIAVGSFEHAYNHLRGRGVVVENATPTQRLPFLPPTSILGEQE